MVGVPMLQSVEMQVSFCSGQNEFHRNKPLNPFGMCQKFPTIRTLEALLLLKGAGIWHHPMSTLHSPFHSEAQRIMPRFNAGYLLIFLETSGTPSQ
jgi:hypothetical protein